MALPEYQRDDVTGTTEQVLRILLSNFTSIPPQSGPYLRELLAGMLEGREVEESSANRLLEVLGAVSENVAIQGFLRQILQHPSPRIRSKITLLMGGGGRAVKAVRKILGDPGEEDPRVLANALEALWSVPNQEVLNLFCEMLDHPNNRVAGNAVLGLYLAGDPKSISLIRKMAARSETLLRQTAAWIMGKTEDPRFLPDVGQLLGQPDATLRKIVFRSVKAIKSAVTRRSNNPPLVLTTIHIARSECGRTQVRLAVAAHEAGEVSRIPATGFAIHAGGKPIDDFTCVERRNDPVCVAFVFPRRQNESDPLRLPVRRALIECLEKKPEGDRWTLVRYQKSTRTTNSLGQIVDDAARTAEKAAERRVLPTLTGNASILSTDLESDGLRSETASSVFEAVNRAVTGMRSRQTARFVLVLADCGEEIESQRFEELAKPILESGAPINVISTAGNPQLEILCRRSSGIFHVVGDISGIGPAVQLLYRSFKSEYFLEFNCPKADMGQGTHVCIHAYNATAFGETTIETSAVT